jgi:hypothetical protein
LELVDFVNGIQDLREKLHISLSFSQGIYFLITSHNSLPLMEESVDEKVYFAMKATFTTPTQ